MCGLVDSGVSLAIALSQVWLCDRGREGVLALLRSVPGAWVARGLGMKWAARMIACSVERACCAQAAWISPGLDSTEGYEASVSE